MAFASDAGDGWWPGGTTASGPPDDAPAGGLGSDPAAGSWSGPRVWVGEPPGVSASASAIAATAAAAPTASCGQPSRDVSARASLGGRGWPGCRAGAATFGN